MFQPRLISWKTRKQPTCEADYMALTAAAQEFLFLRMIVKDFQYDRDEAVLIHGDNQGSLDLAENLAKHQRSKHIDIKYNFIREKCANRLTYPPTSLPRNAKFIYLFF